MKFHIFTLCPKLFESPLEEGVIGRALKSGLVQININNIRDHSGDKHGSVDDYPFGGGPGMLLKPEPIFKSVQSNIERNRIKQILKKSPILLINRYLSLMMTAL